MIILTILLILSAGLLIFMFYTVEKLKKQMKKQPKITKEQEKKIEKTRKAFNNLMEYGYDTALKKEE